MRPRKIKNNALVDNLPIGIEKLVESGIAWLGEFAENYFCKFF